MPPIEEIFSSFVTGKIAPFYHRYYPGLLMYGRRLLGSELEWMAEDCVQDAVIDAFYKRHSFTDAEQWKAHILSCIRNHAVSALRKLSARRNYEADAGFDTHEADSTRALIEHEMMDALFAAIQSLPAEYRELLKMSFEEGLKNAEIAACLGVAEITVKKRKARMLEMLRIRLGCNNIDVIILLLMTHHELIHAS